MRRLAPHRGCVHDGDVQPLDEAPHVPVVDDHRGMVAGDHSRVTVRRHDRIAGGNGSRTLVDGHAAVLGDDHDDAPGVGRLLGRVGAGRQVEVGRLRLVGRAGHAREGEHGGNADENETDELLTHDFPFSALCGLVAGGRAVPLTIASL